MKRWINWAVWCYMWCRYVMFRFEFYEEFCVLVLSNTLRPKQNGWHFADDIFKCFFLNENLWITSQISLKFVPKGPINNIPSLVQIMAWRHPGGKPLSEPTMFSLPPHICNTRPWWVNMFCYFASLTSCLVAAAMHETQAWPALWLQISWHLIMLGNCQSNT